jgi:hypothetical protein
MAGCKDWRRQIQTPDGTPARNPIAVSRFMRHICTLVYSFFSVSFSFPPLSLSLIPLLL